MKNAAALCGSPLILDFAVRRWLPKRKAQLQYHLGKVFDESTRGIMAKEEATEKKKKSNDDDLVPGGNGSRMPLSSVSGNTSSSTTKSVVFISKGGVRVPIRRKATRGSKGSSSNSTSTQQQTGLSHDRDLFVEIVANQCIKKELHHLEENAGEFLKMVVKESLVINGSSRITSAATSSTGSSQTSCLKALLNSSNALSSSGESSSSLRNSTSSFQQHQKSLRRDLKNFERHVFMTNRKKKKELQQEKGISTATTTKPPLYHNTDSSSSSSASNYSTLPKHLGEAIVDTITWLQKEGAKKKKEAAVVVGQKEEKKQSTTSQLPLPTSGATDNWLHEVEDAARIRLERSFLKSPFTYSSNVIEKTRDEEEESPAGSSSTRLKSPVLLSPEKFFKLVEDYFLGERKSQKSQSDCRTNTQEESKKKLIHVNYHDWKGCNGVNGNRCRTPRKEDMSTAGGGKNNKAPPYHKMFKEKSKPGNRVFPRLNSHFSSPR